MKAHKIFLFIGLLSLALEGCKASCEQACRRIINDCEAGIPSYNVKQCAEDCAVVQTDYESRDYLEPQQEAFQGQLDCIKAASCEDLLSPDKADSCYHQFQHLYVLDRKSTRLNSSH